MINLDPPDNYYLSLVAKLTAPKQKAVTFVQVGDEKFEASPEQLQQVAALFKFVENEVVEITSNNIFDKPVLKQTSIKIPTWKEKADLNEKIAKLTKLFDAIPDIFVENEVVEITANKPVLEQEIEQPQIYFEYLTDIINIPWCESDLHRGVLKQTKLPTLFELLDASPGVFVNEK